MRNSFSSHEPILENYEEGKTKKPNYSFDSIFIKRFFRLLKVLFHSKRPNKVWSTSKEARKYSLFWLYMTFIGLSVSYEALAYFVGMTPSRFYTILTSRDLVGFKNFIIPCLLLILSTATVSKIIVQIPLFNFLFFSFQCKSLLNFMGGLFAIKARRLLTTHLQERYIKPKSMYTLVMNHEHIDNP